MEGTSIRLWGQKEPLLWRRQDNMFGSYVTQT